MPQQPATRLSCHPERSLVPLGARRGRRTCICFFPVGLALGLFAFAHPVFGAQSLLSKPAPDFALTDFSGHPLHLSSYRGTVVLLNFWATWCAPCEVEMPVFASWQREFGAQGLQVIGLSMDDDAALARRAADHLKLNYRIAMGNARLATRYGGVLGLPLTFLIDRNGIGIGFAGEALADENHRVGNQAASRSTPLTRISALPHLFALLAKRVGAQTPLTPPSLHYTGP